MLASRLTSLPLQEVEQVSMALGLHDTVYNVSNDVQFQMVEMEMVASS